MILNSNDSQQGLSRREVLKAGLWGAAGTILFPTLAEAAAFKMPKAGSYDISFLNTHTGERFSGTYRVGNKYLPDAFEEINYVLRDFRTNEVFPIDPRVIDIIYMVHRKTGRNQALEILSGYRSPKTNAMLRNASSGVARNSMHLSGQAIDFRMAGVSTRGLRDVAVGLKAGGVGYYARSNFVHVDTGKFRTW
ncbi:MAG: YcbK family protein [Micavibrio sp.]